MLRHLPRPLLIAGLTLALSTLVACGSSKLDAEGYQKAAAGLDGKITQIQGDTKDALMTGDPMMLGRAFESLVPKMQALRAEAAKLKVGDPAMAEAHAGLTSTLDAYVGEFERLEESVTSSVLSDTKKAMKSAVADLEAGLEEWREATGQ